ncbi:MAG: diguanylate cyclase [Pseudomonadota bacterium]
MPGHVLVVDPNLTHRVMLTTQLKQDFFDVDALADDAGLVPALLARTPDAVLLSMAAGQAANFGQIARIRSGPGRAHVPVILMCETPDAAAWDTCHRVQADDVLDYGEDRQVVTQRVNGLVRSKEKIDAMRARQRIFSQMGFAEDGSAFLPAGGQTVLIDARHGGLSAPRKAALCEALRQDFARVVFLNDPPALPHRADITLIDEAALGAEAALRRVAALATAPGIRAPLLYRATATPGAAQRTQKALELGASDVAQGEVCAAELAVRLRRIARQRQAEDRMDALLSAGLRAAMTDPLTGLYNRRYAQDFLTRALTDRDGDRRVSVMMLDIDNFKAINDTYGHGAGDSVLAEVAGRLRRSLRSGDLLARMGGEEFIVVLSDPARSDDAQPKRTQRVAERLRSAVAGAVFGANEGLSLGVSVSIGVSQAKAGAGAAPEQLIKAADRALYAAKHAGRNRVTYSAAAA